MVIKKYLGRNREPPHNSRGGVQPTWVRYQVLAAACVFAFIAYIHRSGFATIGAYLQHGQPKLGDPELGWVMFAFLVGYGAFEVPWGVLGDRLGARHLLAIMMLGWSFLTAAVVLVLYMPGLPWLAYASLQLYFLLLLRFLFGAFQAGGFPSLSRVMTDWMPVAERATAQGIIWTSSRLGGAVAPFLFVSLIHLFGNWPAPWILGAGLGVIWCAVVWPWFRNRPEEMEPVNAAERQLICAGRTTAPTDHTKIPWTRLLGSVSVWALCLMYAFGGFSATFFITLLPAYLKKHRHLSDEAMQWLSGLPLAFGVAACVGGGLLSDWIIRRTGNGKWGRRVCGLVGHAGAGLAILTTIWVQDVWLLGVLLSATFFCNDLAMGPAWACCADIGGRFAGTLGGAMNMLGNLGAALAAVVTSNLFGKQLAFRLPGLGSDAHEMAVSGNHLVFVIFASSFWLACLCWLFVDVTKPLEDQQPVSASPAA